MRLTMMYKITNSLVAINYTDYLKPCLRQNRTYNDLAFILPRTGSDYLINYSFYPRTIKDWNVLPSHIVKAPMDSFKTLLSTV